MLNTLSNVINFGSLNIDYVYSVDHISVPGESLVSDEMEIFPGGKGLNQSIALSRAGVSVRHAGTVGKDGDFLLDCLTERGVDIDLIKKQDEVPTGHAIIQVDKNGQNSIVVFKGANFILTKGYIDSVFKTAGKDSLILLQNETNLTDYIIRRAKENQCITAINPAPFDNSFFDCNIDLIDILILNEIEAEQMCGTDEPDSVMEYFNKKYPQMTVVLTLGENGSVLSMNKKVYRHGIYQTRVEDTTAAGDTFIGYFLSGYMSKMQPEEILRYAATAAGIAVSKKGAATSIPTADEVLKIINCLKSSTDV